MMFISIFAFVAVLCASAGLASWLMRKCRIGLAAAWLIGIGTFAIMLFAMAAADKSFLGGFEYLIPGVLLGYGAAPGAVLGMIWGYVKGPYAPKTEPTPEGVK